MKKLVISMLLTGLVFCFAAAATEPAPQTGAPAPGLELNSLEGKTVKLEQFLGEKKAILVFFTSWSKSCREELADLEKLYDANKAGVEVIAVSFDKKSKDLKNFANKISPALHLFHDKKLTSVDTYQILIIPATFCIGEGGTIEKIFVDYDENVKKAIEEWLRS